MSDDVFNEILYRLAYGAASRLATGRRQSSDPALWRDTSSSVAAGIRVAVARELGRDPDDPDVRDAVDDVLAGRRPRW